MTRGRSDRLPGSVGSTLRRCVLVLAVGGSLAGLTACGSSDSATTDGSTTTVVKEAGGLDKDVQLEVVNRTADAVDVVLCRSSTRPNWAQPLEDADCPTSDRLTPQQSTTLTSAAVSAMISGPDPAHVPFVVAYNPTVGEPYFKVVDTDGNTGIGDPQTFDMVEGEVRRVSVGGVTLQLERQGDSDVKIMRVLVTD